jgi:hypothetical protein
VESKELIQELRSDAEWAHANEWETPITLGDHLDAAADAIEALLSVTAERDAMKERTRWVPVSERLPNMCGFKCLVCAKNKFEQTHVFTAFTGYMEHWKLEFHSCEHPYDDLSAWEITHWMPLPEAPKEANNDESGD